MWTKKFIGVNWKVNTKEYIIKNKKINKKVLQKGLSKNFIIFFRNLSKNFFISIVNKCGGFESEEVEFYVWDRGNLRKY